MNIHLDFDPYHKKSRLKLNIHLFVIVFHLTRFQNLGKGNRNCRQKLRDVRAVNRS